MPELRRSPIDGRWVVVNPERATRPDTFRVPPHEPTGTPASCPFCPGHEHETPPEVARTGEGVADGPGWRVRVVPNLYPIVSGPARPFRATGSRFHDTVGASGAHEVAVMSPDHDRSLPDLNGVEVEEFFEVLVARLRSHAGAGHEYTQLLVNQGREAGASIEHPHAQIVSVDLVPDVVALEVAHVTGGGECSVCRAVAEDADPTSPLAVCPTGATPLWCPWWSAVPFEMMVAPRAHVPRIEHGGPDVGDVARRLAQAAGFLRSALGDVAYNVVLHTAPASVDDFHWHAHLWPRLSIQAGFEQGTGIWVNTMPPEHAASTLRDVGTST